MLCSASRVLSGVHTLVSSIRGIHITRKLGARLQGGPGAGPTL